MNRRTLLKSGLTAGAALGGMLLPATPVSAAPMRTRWSVRTSEGFDALCFLGPLSREPFYAAYYPDELAAFTPKLKPETLATIKRLFAEEKARGGLLGPDLCTALSGGPDATLNDLIAGLDAADTVLKPAYAASPYWGEEEWQAVFGMRSDLKRILADMGDAGFGLFRNGHIAPRAATRLPQLRETLAGLDAIAEQEKLLGRRFPDPSIEVILLYFSKPHGIRIQGQRFLTHIDYPDKIVIRNADHELMHPPFDKNSARMKAVLALLAKDPLLTRIVKEHDRRFGYNSLEGLLDEDSVQALEQIINERFAVSVPPAKRWTEADDGMHVLAAGLYGLLKTDRYDRTGGNLEAWLYAAARDGRLAPKSLHTAAARVLKRSANALWPVPKA